MLHCKIYCYITHLWVKVRLWKCYPLQNENRKQLANLIRRACLSGRYRLRATHAGFREISDQQLSSPVRVCTPGWNLLLSEISSACYICRVQLSACCPWTYAAGTPRTHSGHIVFSSRFAIAGLSQCGGNPAFILFSCFLLPLLNSVSCLSKLRFCVKISCHFAWHATRYIGNLVCQEYHARNECQENRSNKVRRKNRNRCVDTIEDFIRCVFEVGNFPKSAMTSQPGLPNEILCGDYLSLLIYRVMYWAI